VVVVDEEKSREEEKKWDIEENNARPKPFKLPVLALRRCFFYNTILSVVTRFVSFDRKQGKRRRKKERRRRWMKKGSKRVERRRSFQVFIILCSFLSTLAFFHILFQVLFYFFFSLVQKKTYVKNGNPVYISLSFFLIFFFQTIRSENYQRSFATFTYLNNNKKRRRRRRRKRNDRMK